MPYPSHSSLDLIGIIILVEKGNITKAKLNTVYIASNYTSKHFNLDRLCGLVVRILGCRSGGPGSIPDTTKKSSGSGTGSTQPREYN
jgi:hypothetical protein